MNTNRSNLLIIFIFFVLYSLLLIFKIYHYDGYIIDWDEAHHLRMAHNFFQAYSINYKPWITDLFTKSGQIYPPLYHLLIAASYHVFGISSRAAIFVNIPFVFVLMFSIYKICDYFGNKQAGIFAAILTPILPVFLSLQERAAIDYSNISLFVLSFYILFKTKGFTNTKYSIILGILLCLNLLIKWPFLVPALPFCLYAIVSFYKRRSSRKVIFQNLISTLSLFSLGFIWYYYNFKYIYGILNFYWNPNGFPQTLSTTPHGLSLKNILLYAFTIPVERGVGIIPLCIVYYSIFKMKINKGISYLLLSVGTVYLFLTMINDKSDYYIAYSYPLLMVITFLGLYGFKSIKIKKYGILLLTVSILANFILSQFNYFAQHQLKINLFSLEVPILPNYPTKFTEPVWPTKYITDYFITNDVCKNGVLVFPDSRFLNAPVINYYLAIKNKKVEAKAAYELYNPATDISFDLDILDAYSCIITKTKDPGIYGNSEVIEFVNKFLGTHQDFVHIVFDAPDKSSIFLFIRNR